jgi:hypothetical protein
MTDSAHDTNAKCPPCIGVCRQGRMCPANVPQWQFLAEPPRPPREPGDGWKVLAILALTAVLPLLVIGCVAIFGRHA